MVEFALILPLLILLVFGVIEFSRAYNTWTTMTHAAREGVRVLALTGEAEPAEEAAKDAAPILDRDDITVTTTACDPGQPTSLTVTYPHILEIPLFGSFSFDLSSTGVMRCGG